MATAMAIAADEYTKDLEFHWEGSEIKILHNLSELADKAEAFLNALFNLGPQGRKVALGEDISIFPFIVSERGKWLMDLVINKKEALPWLEDTPFAGRPVGTTVAQQVARLKLLNTLNSFLTYHRNKIEFIPARALVPEIARAIHRIVCDPDLPKDSQLFRKEWEGPRRSKMGSSS